MEKTEPIDREEGTAEPQKEEGTAEPQKEGGVSVEPKKEDSPVVEPGDSSLIRKNYFGRQFKFKKSI